MDYYQCPTEDLLIEAQRRGFPRLWSSRDQLIEVFIQDDEAKGSDATTISTTDYGAFIPRTVSLEHTAALDKTDLASQLINESASTKCVVREDGRADYSQRLFTGR